MDIKTLHQVEEKYNYNLIVSVPLVTPIFYFNKAIKERETFEKQENNHRNLQRESRTT